MKMWVLTTLIRFTFAFWDNFALILHVDGGKILDERKLAASPKWSRIWTNRWREKLKGEKHLQAPAGVRGSAGNCSENCPLRELRSAHYQR
jgi:hypothetical protein